MTYLYGDWESNVLRDQPDGSPDYLYGVRGSLFHEHRSRRSRVRLSLDASGRWYRELEGENQFEGAGSLGLTQSLSAKASLGLDFGYSRRFTDQLRVLNDLGLQVPLTKSEAVAAGGRLDLQLTQRSRWSVDARYDHVGFDSDVLIDTDSLGASSTLARRAGAHDEIWINYFFRRTNRETGYDAHSAALGWGHRFSRRVSLNLDSGASYVPVKNEPLGNAGPAQWFYYGGASLIAAGRRNSLDFSYRKSITPGYGLDRNFQSDVVRLAASIALGRNAGLTIAGTHTWSRDVFVSSERFTGDYADVGLWRRLGRDFGLSLRYGYRRRDVEGSVPVDSHSAGLALTHTLGRP